MRILSIDPGKGRGASQGFGWATLSLAGGLHDFDVFRPPSYAATLPAIANFFAQWLGARIPNVDLCVVERMVVYPPRPRERAKARSRHAETAIANDLLDLQAIAALVAGHLVPLHQIVYRRPAEWKGSLDSAVVRRRLPEDVQARIAELRPAGLQHNAVDAIAMGMVELGTLRLR